ncbi:MAG: TIGR03759 family integrating conjugative element protein [Haliea sp.]
MAQSTTTLPSQSVKTPQVDLSLAAENWDLTEEEFRQYQALMTGRRGLWSPGIDPITALGVSAETEGERRRYAELYVRAEFQRTRQELAFQVAVNEAWKRLYTSTPPLLPYAPATADAGKAQRYALIVGAECPACIDLMSDRLDSLLAEAPEGVDVHVVRTEGNDDALRGWVARFPILETALRQGRATINHGEEMTAVTELPALYRKNGANQWVRQE